MNSLYLLLLVSLLVIGAILGGEEFQAIKDEIFQLKKNGKEEEVLKLQADLKDKIDQKYRDQSSTKPKLQYDPRKSRTSSRSHHDRHERRLLEREAEYEERINERLQSHHEERYQARRAGRDGGRSSDSSRSDRYARARSSRPQRDYSLEKGHPLLKGISDERAVYHMSQSNKKASIVHTKLSKFNHLFSSEEMKNYQDMMDSYMQLEKVVATYLQKTSDDYAKARTMPDKDQRRAYLDSVKAAWDLRKPAEKQAREAARDSFLEIKKMVEGHIGAKTEL